jgi:hypothetical protein
MARRWNRGMTLAELLAVSCILVVMAGAMSALAIGVQESNQYNYQHGVSLQHAQVTLQRIQHTLNSATANATFPAFLIFADTVGVQLYPDTLVVWNPTTSAVNPDGLPLMNELVVYCPNPNDPQELWEIRAPNDSRTAPNPSNTSQWRTELTYLKSNSTVQRVVLTNALRTASTSNGVRGVIRFESRLRPSQLEWAMHVAGLRAWEDMSWVQGIYGSATGLRQAWCRFEFQLRPGDTRDNSRDAAIPFFGSGAVMYELHKP